MIPPHSLPIPPAILSRAFQKADEAAARMPFSGKNVPVSRGLLAAALEELNAEPARTLAIRCRYGNNGRVITDGLDRHLALRGFAEPGTADAASEFLIMSGIAAKASVTEKRSHRFVRGVTLLPAWTWTFAASGTGNASSLASTGPAPSARPAWTALCPVCREGRLEAETGQNFLGVHGTESFACISCGARFVPEDCKFRLVAIAKKRDPEWSNLLNRKYSADAWLEIAEGRHEPGPFRRGTARSPRGGRRSGPETEIKTGTRGFTVDVGERTLYLVPLKIRFIGRPVTDLFAGRRDSINSILSLPEYSDCAASARAICRTFPDAPAGPFLLEAKNRCDPVYLQFLNEFGENRFCTFRAGPNPITGRRGILFAVENDVIRALCACPVSFRESVDCALGSLSPESCYRDGDAMRCRINALVCANRKEGGGLYVYPATDSDEIRELSRSIRAGTRLQTV